MSYIKYKCHQITNGLKFGGLFFQLNLERLDWEISNLIQLIV